jgi:hypothetical protein
MPPWCDFPPADYGSVESMAASIIEALIDRGMVHNALTAATTSSGQPRATTCCSSARFSPEKGETMGTRTRLPALDVIPVQGAAWVIC